MKAPEVIRQNENTRVVVRTVAELFDEGKDDKGKYAGGKWGGLYLRAPDIYFRILEKAGDRLVRLGDVAEVRYGLKTGANNFFYLQPVKHTVKEVAELSKRNPKAPVRVRNGFGWEGVVEAGCLRPLLFSLKEVLSIHPDLEQLRRCVFVCSKTLDELRKQGYKHTVDYIEFFARFEVRQRSTTRLLPDVPSLRSRRPWYALPEGQQDPDFVVNQFLGERFVFPEGGNLQASNVFFIGYFAEPSEKAPLVAALNATITALMADVLARKTYGIGVAYLYGPEIASIPVLDPNFLSEEDREIILSAYEQLRQRKAKSIFEELGFPLCRSKGCQHPEHPYEHVDPQALALEQVRQASPDRYELDSVVFDILGLTERERLEVYQAVVQLVKTRLVKANSTQEPPEIDWVGNRA